MARQPRFLDAWAFPANERATLHVTLPCEIMNEIDEAVRTITPPLQDREAFVKLAVRWALNSLAEKAETLRLSLEE